MKTIGEPIKEDNQDFHAKAIIYSSNKKGLTAGSARLRKLKEIRTESNNNV